jgi:transposase-like protein
MVSTPPRFPASLRAFQTEFADEAACERYLAACRWPDGFRCPRCEHDRAFVLTERRRWQCANRDCRYQASLTAGTVLHNTKTPLALWFWAAYLMTTDKRGISATLLQRHLEISRNETAWMILHKLRRAMVDAGREKLRGEIEMDEFWVGGPQSGVRGSRQLKGRKAALVVVAIEKRGKGSGRVRMEVIPDFTMVTMTDFVTRNIEVGATIHTDKMPGFRGLTAAGYKHLPEKAEDTRKGGKRVVPRADRAIGNLKQWLLGTYHGVSRTHLQTYLDEFVFRHNRRGNPQAAFQRLLGLGTSRGPTPYTVISGARDLQAFPIRR